MKDKLILTLFTLLMIVYMVLFAYVIYHRVKHVYYMKKTKNDIQELKYKVKRIAYMEGLLKMNYNTKNLMELTKKEATSADYEKYLSEVARTIKEKYANYDFQIHEPVEGEVDAGWTLEFVIHRAGGAYTDAYDNLFRIAIGAGLDQGQIVPKFVEKVKLGEVLDLGDVIVQEPITGTGPITSGEDMRVLISFTTPELVEKSDPLKAKKEAERVEQEEERKEKQEKQRTAYMEITKASAMLGHMAEEIVEAHPEYTEKLEELKEMYGHTLG